MKQTRTIRLLLGVFLTALLWHCQKGSDYYLVIDTSGSMALPVDSRGQTKSGAEDKESTISRIQSELKSFLANLQKGDSVTLLRFDDEPQSLGRVLIESDADKKRIEEQIASLEAKGRYTDMAAMLVALREMTQKRSKEDRPQILIVMSDGKDDPPPDAKRKPFDLAEVASAPPASDDDKSLLLPKRYYVYYVSLGKVQDKGLERRLAELSDSKVKLVKGARGSADKKATGKTEPAASGQTGTETLHATDDGQTLSVVQEDIKQETRAERYRFWGLILLAVLAGIFLILLLLWLLLKFLNRNKPRGKFIYYEKAMGPNMKEEKDLGKIVSSKFSLGSKTGVDLKIRELGVNRVHLKAAKIQGEDVLRLANKNEEGLFDFKKQARPHAISHGDLFQLGNCVIEYVNEQDANK